VPGGFGKGRLEKDCPHETTRKDFWHVRGNNSTSPTAYFISLIFLGGACNEEVLESKISHE
jgi:hypothetical protein